MVATVERNGHSRIPPKRPQFTSTPRPERTTDGRFAAGNPGGPGNPFARKSAQHRSVLCEGFSDQDVLDLGQTLLLRAKQGDMTAARLLLQYTIGKPGEAKDPDRMDQDEWELLKDRQQHSLKEMNDTLEGFPLGVILGLTKALTRILEDTLSDKFIALGQKPDDGGSTPPKPSAPPSPRTPPSGPPPVRNEDSMGGINGTKTTPETAPNQPPAECMTAPIEPGKVGAVGTTCPSPEDPNFDPDSDLDEGEFEGGLTEEEVLAELGMPASVDESKRFRRILASLHTVHALPVPGVDPISIPSSDEETLESCSDQPLAECVTAPIEPGKVGAVGTTCPSAQKEDSQENPHLVEEKLEEDLDPEALFETFGIPAQVLEDPRFQNLLGEIHSLYEMHTQQGPPNPETPSQGETA